MSDDFIDSNVLVYLFNETDESRKKTAERVLESALEDNSGAISFQVVQETLSVITTKLKPSVLTEDAQRFLDKVLVPLWRIMPSRELYRRALDIQRQYRYHFYDGLIIAATLEAGCAPFKRGFSTWSANRGINYRASFVPNDVEGTARALLGIKHLVR